MELRFAERNCFCRFCDKHLEKKVDMAVFHYSSMNRGMNIIICEECCRKLGKLWKDDSD